MNMSARLAGLDRLVALLAGLVLVGSGLAGLDWQFRVLGGEPTRMHARPALVLAATAWWPWAVGIGGLVLGLLMLWWLLAHLGGNTARTLRSVRSGPSGRVAVDLASVARVAADSFCAEAGLSHPRSTTHRVRHGYLVEMQGAVTVHTDPAEVRHAADAVTRQVVEAFPDDEVNCRMVVRPPRGRR